MNSFLNLPDDCLACRSEREITVLREKPSLDADELCRLRELTEYLLLVEVLIYRWRSIYGEYVRELPIG
jgi:hypothetical protein